MEEDDHNEVASRPAGRSRSQGSGERGAKLRVWGGNERQWRKEALKQKARSRCLQKVGEAEGKQRSERCEEGEAEVKEARPARGRGLR